MSKISPLPPKALHAVFPPGNIPWNDSREIPSSYLIRNGKTPFQPRAMHALDLALQISEQGYNVYLSGEPNLDRTRTLLRYLTPRADKKNVPPDLVYVRNFADPDSPVLLALPAGQGRKLKKNMEDVLSRIPEDLERRLDTMNYERQRAVIMEEFQQTRSSLLKRMNSEAENNGFNLDMDENGAISLTPIIGGKRISEDEFGKMDSSLRYDLKRKGDRLAKNLLGYARKLNRAEDSFHNNEISLNQKIMAETLDSLLTPLAQRFSKTAPSPEMAAYLNALREDIIKNTESFLSRGPEKRDDAQGAMPIGNRYKINLFVDNAGLKGAPVIVEDNPSYFNLLGCMERESEMGALVTDFTLIRAGSLHRANGGFLVLHMRDLFEKPSALEGLLRALAANRARIEDDDSADAGVRTRGLHPSPLELDIKVILIGDEDSYEYMVSYEERFPRLFRIKAHMNDVTERNAVNIRAYLGEISQIIKTGELLPFDRGALAWLVDHGSHLCEDQRRLSLKFPILRELMVEACAAARLSGKELVDSRMLEDAYARRVYRSNLVEEIYMEEFDRQLIKVRTSGKEIGQVNGLSILENGEFEFGVPDRISCTVGVGNEGITDLEREAELGGPIHTKAIMILKSYLTGIFARKKPLIMSASIYFEQSYGQVEGDSASGAELAALLSALAEVPIRLDLAFTGAVSHCGEIMAVGGVTRKIEGFYNVCAKHGLTGTQGVIIPRDNIAHLMLAPEIIASVEKSEFFIYPVSNIGEALFLLTGLPIGRPRKNGGFTAGSLHDLVDKRLEQLGRHAQHSFRKVS